MAIDSKSRTRIPRWSRKIFFVRFGTSAELQWAAFVSDSCDWRCRRGMSDRRKDYVFPTTKQAYVHLAKGEREGLLKKWGTRSSWFKYNLDLRLNQRNGYWHRCLLEQSVGPPLLLSRPFTLVQPYTAYIIVLLLSVRARCCPHLAMAIWNATRPDAITLR